LSRRGSALILARHCQAKSTLVIDVKPQFDHRRMTTAEIVYRRPDRPDLLQSYIWQGLDTAPDYPALRRFLEFWSRNLDGKLHSVRIAQAGPGRQAPTRRLLH
jgi:uncharacterized protein Usg